MDTISFLENILHDGWAKLPTDRHDDFLRALRHSLTIESKIYTPTSFEPFGFTQRELYDLLVLLMRPLAYEFAKSLDADISKSHFDKRTTYAAYERHFGRQPWLISTKPRIMLLTYTEWLELALDELPEITLPESLGLNC